MAKIKTKEYLVKELLDFANEKISRGIVAAEEAKKRIECMVENHVDPSLAKRVIAGWRKYNRPARQLSCLYTAPYYKEGAESIVADLDKEETKNV